MLRITMTEDSSEQRWVLQGRMTSSFLEDLTDSWRVSKDRWPAQNRVVDLDEVTCIDKDGEQVLLMMMKDGFLASWHPSQSRVRTRTKSSATNP